MKNSWHIKGGRVVDPANGRDEIADLCVSGGVICSSVDELPANAGVIDASGLVVVPGLIDIHSHLRGPGEEAAETVETGATAAARGGFTTVVAMPNTRPAIDSPDLITETMRRGRDCGRAHVLVAGCISRGRAGKELADLAGMRDAGAVAFTDDGATVADQGLMRAAMASAASLDVPIMDHALEACDGVMHEGEVSRSLGLAGIPREAETRVVARDIELARETGCRIHIQHISARETVDLVSDANAAGVQVTCELTPHHLSLVDQDIDGSNTSFKVSPPLRTTADRLALQNAAAAGVIRAFATDHAPHTDEAKSVGFVDAPSGMIGLETAIGVTYTTAVASGLMDLRQWLEMWTTGPASVLSLPTPGLSSGQAADIGILDLDTEWVARADQFVSRSRNSPYCGRTLKGRAMWTLCDGRLTWAAAEIPC